MIKMVLTNFKALVKPKEFVDLTYYSGGITFIYMLLMTVFTTLLCVLIPYSYKAPQYADTIVTYVKKVLPEFQYANSEFNLLDKEEQYITGEDWIVYYKTDVDYISTSVSDGNAYIAKQFSQHQLQEMLNKELVVIVSESNMIVIQNGAITSEGRISEIFNTFNVGYLDYDQLQQKMPGWIRTITRYGCIITIISYMLSLFLGGIGFGIFAAIVNLIVGSRYPFKHLFKLAIYVQIPFNLAYQICVFVMFKSSLSPICLVLYAMLFVYIILALVQKKKKDGAYGMKFGNTSWKSNNNYGGFNNGGYNDQNNNYGGFNNGGYNDQNNNYGGNYGGNYNARQYDAMGGSNTGYQTNTYGMNPNGNFESNSFGTNPNAGYQANSYGMNQNGAPTFQTPVYKPGETGQLRPNSGYNPNPAFSASNQETQAVNQYLTPAMMNARSEETKEKDELVERAQHDVYQRNTKVYDKEQLNQMQAKPVARELNATRDFAQSEQYAAQNRVWKPKVEEEKIMVDEPKFTSQKWQPQAEFDYKGEKEKWNENMKKWDFNQKTTFQQEWNPQKATAKDDDIFGQKNEWQSNQMVWKSDSVNSTPLPSQPATSQQVSNFAPLPQVPAQQTLNSQEEQSKPDERTSESFQWKQTPVWGVKDDSLDEF